MESYEERNLDELVLFEELVLECCQWIKNVLLHSNELLLPLDSLLVEPDNILRSDTHDLLRLLVKKRAQIELLLKHLRLDQVSVDGGLYLEVLRVLHQSIEELPRLLRLLGLLRLLLLDDHLGIVQNVYELKVVFDQVS